MDELLQRVGRFLTLKGRQCPEQRVIKIRSTSLLEPEVVSKEERYCDNRIKSSKYTILNFLPKNLFEQFRRIANFYFLIMGLIQLIIDSPVSPATSILPLLFVVSVTAIKQGYEDWLRHKADNEVNNQLVDVLSNGELEKIKAKDIKVGDIVRVSINKGFPCDMVMISSENSEGSCYVTTANLDGETNLKTFTSATETKSYQSVEQLKDLNATITCKQPLVELYNFVGYLSLKENENEETEIPLGTQNLLLRGARLRNTPFIYGCAVYTGQQTKMALNSKFKSAKVSVVERTMNAYLKFFLCLLVIEVGVCTGLHYWFAMNMDMTSYWYLDAHAPITASKVVEDFLAFLVILNYTIPISLYVTIEVQKFIGSKFFAWDLSMYDEDRNLAAKPNTSDLNEELGQVEYLFTDKTGTLTQNSMKFQQCIIGDKCYIDFKDQLCEKPEVHEVDPEPVKDITQEIKDFFEVLALCHTVRVDYSRFKSITTGRHYSVSGIEYCYQASSPDEKAFLDACRKYEVVFHGTYESKLRVSFQGDMMQYILLDCFDFDSDRKRMSVVVKNDKDEIYLLCKGAECAIMDRIVSGHKCLISQQINYYAKLGLRTLVIARKQLTPEEYTTAKQKIAEAKKDLKNREEMLSKVFNEVEDNLILLGATGVEDKLQDGVPETMRCLRDAGIKIWVLTGDKEETAVNISYSAGHFQEGSFELRLTNFKISNSSDIVDCQIELRKHLDIVNDKLSYGSRYVLIVDGSTLTILLKHNKEDLRTLCMECSTVLCCRLIPLQKASIVNLIKTSKLRPITAAIGDGANDVSMIQEAHVGLGLFGKEGRQAVRCSDYAFSQFRFLIPALLKHGHYYYVRVANLVQYFFYKNIAFITTQIYYGYFNTFSQQSLFESFLLMFYNITFTSLPIFIYGLFEQDINCAELMTIPTIYRGYYKNKLLSGKQFLKWNLLALWHSLVVYFGVQFLISDAASLFEDGKSIGNWSFGFMVYFVCTVTVNLKLAVETYSWYHLFALSFIITFVGSFILLFIYDSFLWSQFFDSNNLYMILQNILTSGAFWLCLIILPCVALLPDYLIKFIYDVKYHNKFQRAGCLIYSSPSIELLGYKNVGDAT
ncbi:probable phospholipid-transporting ATPase IF [Octopus sinensis]|uniref:Phospholipid-transporting ATPase n=1 Tax=Octopus sinensis TaxID=2607531 RepID=A0A6P7TES4_9MOLL|nr:probable phospholipid-transporting ATPase IF [Octopus sinensis]